MRARRLTNAERDLAARYATMAESVARLWLRRHPGSPRDEVFSAAGWGLVEAAARFDPARGVSFATYAGTIMRHRIRDALRLEVPRGLRQARYRGEAVPTVAHADDLDDRPDDAEPVGWAVDDEDAVRALLDLLPPRERAIVDRVHLRGDAQADACRAVKLSQSRVSRLYRDALATLRAHLEARP